MIPPTPTIKIAKLATLASAPVIGIVLMIFIATEMESIIIASETANFTMLSAFAPSTCLNVSINKIIDPAISSSAPIELPKFTPFALLTSTEKAAAMPATPRTPLRIVLLFSDPILRTARTIRLSASAMEIMPVIFFVFVLFMKRLSSNSTAPRPTTPRRASSVFMSPSPFTASTSRLTEIASPIKDCFSLIPFPAILMNSASSVSIIPIPSTPLIAVSTSMCPSRYMGTTISAIAPAAFSSASPLASTFLNNAVTSKSSPAISVSIPMPFHAFSASILESTTIAPTITAIDPAILSREVAKESLFLNTLVTVSPFFPMSLSKLPTPPSPSPIDARPLPSFPMPLMAVISFTPEKMPKAVLMIFPQSTPLNCSNH